MAQAFPKLELEDIVIPVALGGSLEEARAPTEVAEVEPATVGPTVPPVESQGDTSVPPHHPEKEPVEP